MKFNVMEIPDGSSGSWTVDKAKRSGRVRFQARSQCPQAYGYIQSES